jgi:hypothetical protein
LKRLGSVEDAWAVAVWFHFPNGWINRRDRIEIGPIAPKDALDLREAVLEAAAKRQGTYVA